jgi:flagellar biosynthesis protein FlhG
VSESFPPDSLEPESGPVDDPRDDPHDAFGGRGARRLLAVGGGRGGAGKSLVSQNLAVYLAQLGKRVTLVDCDPTGANLHTQFGIEALARPIDGNSEDLSKLTIATSVPGLSILPAPHDALEAPLQLRAGRKTRWLSRLRAIPADYLVVDVGPGHASLAVDLMLAADIGICVTVPEPPAIEATYRFVRAAFRRRLRRALVKDRFRLGLVERACKEIGKLPSPLELVKVLWKTDRSIAELAWAEAHRTHFYLAVNQTRVRTDLELAATMSALCRRHYGIALDELGWVEHDDTVWLSVRRRRPLLVDSPTSKAARNLERLARRVVALTATKQERHEPAPPLAPPPGAGMSETNPIGPASALDEPDLYAVLSVGRSSNDEEVRRAYKRQKEVYATSGLATTSLLDETALAAAQSRIDEAHDTLLDPVRRRAYDLSTFPEPASPAQSAHIARPALAAEQLLLQSELAREIGPDTEFTGSLLRKVRESQGVELAEISSRTKISKTHLAALEEESYVDLPAMVYVRGFVSELAKYLRLDPAQVQRTYLRRMREKPAS